jgi:hypothetical protein
MKKIILIFLISINAIAQNPHIGLSIGIDARNVIEGSKPTNFESAADMTYQFFMADANGIEVAISYESFKRICFDKYSIGLGYQIPLTKKLAVVPSVDYNLIGRWGKSWGTTSSHLGFGGNVAIRYFITERIGIETCGNALQRVDLNVRYHGKHIVYSGYLKIIYKIKIF